MNINTHIKHWACLVNESEDNSQFEQEDQGTNQNCTTESIEDGGKSIGVGQVFAVGINSSETVSIVEITNIVKNHDKQIAVYSMYKPNSSEPFEENKQAEIYIDNAGYQFFMTDFGIAGNRKSGVNPIIDKEIEDSNKIISQWKQNDEQAV